MPGCALLRWYRVLVSGPLRPVHASDMPARAPAPITLLLPACSDWLSNEFEADIEQLEVNSSQTPLRKQQAAVAAAAAREDEQPLQLEQPGRSPPNGGASSTGSEPAVLPSRIPQPPQHSTQRSQRTRPLLPGLPLLSDSPQQGVSGPAAPALAPTPEPSQPPQERPLHSLFDLAALDDLSDLISS